MASGIYNNTSYDNAVGAIDFDTDPIKVLLLGSGYTFSKAHDRRDDLGANEVTGTGYTAGGAIVAVTVTKDAPNNRTEIALGQVTWPSSTIANAYGASYYKSRGGTAANDELIAHNDFGGPISTTSGTFTLPAFTIQINNPS